MKKAQEIKATPESYHTSKLSPIILEEGKYVQTSFVGKQVDNYGNIKKNIKGMLVIKKKNKDIELFDEIDNFSRKDIKSKDLVEIDFDTDATYELGKGLYNYFRLFSGKYTNPYAEVAYVEKDEQFEKIKEILESDERLADVITKIDVQTLNAALNIENLRRVRNAMTQNMGNDHEADFWQPFFEQNAWVLSQLFHAPVIFFAGKRYIGGKGMDNHGGQYTDFIFKNDITDNVAIVEIKSPVKAIIDGEYRQSYMFSPELIGGVNQLLLQKDTLTKNYKNLVAEADEYYRATNIECILVYGNIGILDRKQKDAFENYRNELRSIRLIGFDELLMRINNLLALLENRPDISDDEEDGKLLF